MTLDTLGISQTGKWVRCRVRSELEGVKCEVRAINIICNARWVDCPGRLGW